jgi:hypothetical protein
VSARPKFRDLNPADAGALLSGLFGRARANLTADELAALASCDEGAVSTVGRIASLCDGLEVFIAQDERMRTGAFQSLRTLSVLLFAVGGMAELARGVFDQAAMARTALEFPEVAAYSAPNPPPFPIRSRHRFRPMSATKMARRGGRRHRLLRNQRTLPAQRQFNATKRPFKRADRRPGSEPQRTQPSPMEVEGSGRLPCLAAASNFRLLSRLLHSWVCPCVAGIRGFTHEHESRAFARSRFFLPRSHATKTP